MRQTWVLYQIAAFNHPKTKLDFGDEFRSSTSIGLKQSMPIALVFVYSQRLHILVNSKCIAVAQAYFGLVKTFLWSFILLR